jgi:hypothetical protein
MAIKERYTIESARFEKDLESNIIELQNRLIWNEYRNGGEPFVTDLVCQAVLQVIQEENMLQVESFCAIKRIITREYDTEGRLEKEEGQVTPGTAG